MPGLQLLLTLLLRTAGANASPVTRSFLESGDVLATAKLVNEYALRHVVSDHHDQPSRGSGCQWTRSTYMVGLAEYYAATASALSPDTQARTYLANWGQEFGYQLCKADPEPWTGPCAPTNASLGPALGCGDNQLCGAVYIELYKHGLDRPVPRSPSTLQATVAQFDAEIELGAQTDSSWGVIDVTYMAMAPLSRLGALTGKRKYFDKQWANWRSSMLQPPTGQPSPPPSPSQRLGAGGGDGLALWNVTDRLFHRDETKLGTKIYWGRGNGWAMLGLVDALRWGGIVDPHRSTYLAVYKEFASRLLELQGADGAWRSSLLGSQLFPTPETSGTACFTHGLAYGVNAGLLEKSTFAPAVRKAWDFLTQVAMHQHNGDDAGRLGYCQSPGGGPANASVKFDSNSTSDFCVGMMLMASAQVAAMVQ
jgi:unsaturated rhamnogalacturonyl hydrolase